MNPRELIILLLGFVMVAVLLRGLFVAIQVRKGQIRLTIDKNIPQDFDLEELELAELPAGGARVVSRADASEEIQSDDRFDELRESTLANEDSIPILMDVVELEDSGRKSEELGAKHQEQDIIGAGFHEDAVSAAPYNPSKEMECDWNVTHTGSESFQSTSVVHQEFDEVMGDEPAWKARDNSDPRVSRHEDANDLPEHLNSARSIQKASHKSEISDYPENEWYEDDELYAGLDRLHEETVNDSLEIDYASSAVERSENLNSASSVSDEQDEFTASDKGDSLSDKTSLDSSESEDFSEFENFDNFSMTAGERIGFDEIPTHSDLEERATDDEQHLSNKSPALRDGLNRLFSVFKSKPNEEMLEETRISEGKQTTLQSDLIEELEDFIDQSEDNLSFEDNEDEFDPTQDQLDNDYEQGSNLDNVTSIEQAVASSGRSNDPETEKRENSPKILSKSIDPDPSQVLVISAMSPSGSVFDGRHLVQAIERAGFQYGEMGIFHLYDGIEGDTNLICSAANALNPGTFDLDQLSVFSTIGISFFLALPTSINNLQAFQRMLNAAQQISSDLGGELKDDQRNVLTSQTIEHYRQRIRDFQLDQLKVAGGRS